VILYGVWVIWEDADLWNRYLEYDGKNFGLGEHEVSIHAFKGHKKITSLAAYPLEYHKDAEVSGHTFLEFSERLRSLPARRRTNSLTGHP
jgi:hypothetical protein